jgi:hypothetical protein
MSIEKKFIDKLLENGWSVKNDPSPAEVVDEKFTSRFPEIPSAYLSFFNMKQCLSQDKAVWFLTNNEYNRKSDNVFAWDGFERLALESCVLPIDQNIYNEALKFWSETLPILIAVRGDWEYIGIKTKGENAGCVVYGFTPFAEDPDIINENFYLFMESVLNEKTNYLISNIFNFK